MPLGWERINLKRSQPNKNIVFIKPRPGPDEATSRDYLERIAAQCVPVMKKNYLSVVSLEEYEPNLEFWGRNFNNGEVIQLVLRSPTTGRWLPFKFVQMVMMHELAHCKEMNHSKAFWKVRNGYAQDMKELWEQGYTGDGLWGRGVLLDIGMFEGDQLVEGEALPEHMCGGTFKSRGRGKRKMKPKITWKEAKERRIKRKFGINGVALGADDETKAKLEKGKKVASKPRVAGSARGRELRAAAALARFEVKKVEKDEELVTDSEAEEEFEDDVKIKAEPDDAVDINGERLLDSKGNGMVKVCGDEDGEDDDAQRELQELQGIRRFLKPKDQPAIKQESRSDEPRPSKVLAAEVLLPMDSQTPRIVGHNSNAGPKSSEPARNDMPSLMEKDNSTLASTSSLLAANPGDCPICSVKNSLTALTCMVCSNVLQPDFVVGSWRCRSGTCSGSKYINAGDLAICGVCGEKKDT